VWEGLFLLTQIFVSTILEIDLPLKITSTLEIGRDIDYPEIY
jgi:hypothetical protein